MQIDFKCTNMALSRKPMKIFIGAGEISGDMLGGKLIAELKRRHPDLQIIGVGGASMMKAGLPKSLFSIEDLSVMGVLEILPKLFKILRHLRRTKKFILKEKPDVIVTIDASDFYLRLVKAVKKRRAIPSIHYHAPAVWASRPGRAKKIASFVDHLLCLFPFDPPHFTRHGMKATFIGHPLTEDMSEASRFSQENKKKISPSLKGMIDKNVMPFNDLIIDTSEKEGKNEKIRLHEDVLPITVLFGSRTQEVFTLTEPFLEACVRLQKAFPNLFLLIPTFERFKSHLKEHLDKTALPYLFIHQEQKDDAFKVSKAALAASGTVALELAKAELPFVIGYKLSKLSYHIAKRIVITPYICLINVILGKKLVDECLQDECNGKTLEEAMLKLLHCDEKALASFKKELSSAFHQLKATDIAPSQMACDVIDSYLVS